MVIPQIEALGKKMYLNTLNLHGYPQATGINRVYTFNRREPLDPPLKNVIKT